MRVSKPIVIAISITVIAHCAMNASANAADVAPIAQHILSQPRSAQVMELTDAMALLSPEDQTDLLRRVFRDADGPLAAQSIAALIRLDQVDNETRDLFDLEIRDWHPTLQSFAVQTIRDIPSVEVRRQYADVLRTVCDVALDRYDMEPDAKSMIVVDWSILALARMSDPRASADAKAVIQRMPGSSGAWIVLLDSGTIGDEERAMAQTIFDDVTRRAPLRVLAAIALGGAHQAAHEYVEAALNGIVDEFGERVLEAMLEESMRSQMDDPSRQTDYLRFLRDSLPVLSYMSLVKDGSLNATLRRCAAARNEYIRDMARYAIAVSSPSLVLEEPPCIADADLLLEAAAAAAILHPELEGELEQRFGAEALEAKKPQVRTGDGRVWFARSMSPLPLPE